MFGYNSMQWEFWFIVLGIPLAVFGFVFVIRATIQEHKQQKAALERLEKLVHEDPEKFKEEWELYNIMYPSVDHERPAWLNIWYWLYAFVILGVLLGGASGWIPLFPR